MTSRHGQWPDPWAGVTECCSLLAGHREITGGGEASIERGRSGGSQSRIVEPQCRPGLNVATCLIDEWNKIGLHVTHLDADCRRGEQYAPRVWGGPAFPLRAAKHWL